MDGGRTTEGVRLGYEFAFSARVLGSSLQLRVEKGTPVSQSDMGHYGLLHILLHRVGAYVCGPRPSAKCRRQTQAATAFSGGSTTAGRYEPPGADR